MQVPLAEDVSVVEDEDEDVLEELPLVLADVELEGLEDPNRDKARDEDSTAPDAALLWETELEAEEAREEEF
jgi:hypothetical protein